VFVGVLELSKLAVLLAIGAAQGTSLAAIADIADMAGVFGTKAEAGLVVLCVWSIYWLGRLARPEASWLDRAGRLLGSALILSWGVHYWGGNTSMILQLARPVPLPADATNPVPPSGGSDLDPPEPPAAPP
jgi:hypothetical protein